MADNRPDIEAIFHAAQQMGAQERDAYLAEICGEDKSLRQRLDQLLAAQGEIGSFLEGPAVEGFAEAFVDISNSEGTKAETAESADDAISLGFLSPSVKPGSLGCLGHYEVLEVIGRGGMGIVLRAFDEKLHRIVAIKVMAAELASTSPPRKRFLREARSAAQVRHEFVVDIHAVEEQPIPYLVMEYVAGETLQEMLDRVGPLEVADVLRLGQQIARGLAAAHKRGLIHRDIKPSNILIENGVEERVKITDFGLARAAADASLTQSGVIAGTPMYMAPEQTVGDSIDHRADLFSLGSVLYTMCSGRPPFRATTSMATLKRVAEDQPRPIREIMPEVPEWLCGIISRLHAKKPDERFQTAKEVADLLGKCLTDLQQGKPITLDLAAATTVQPKGSSDEVPPRPAGDQAGGWSFAWRPWMVGVAALILLLCGLSLTEATGVTEFRTTVIRIFLPDGTLVVKTGDPRVKVTIEGDGGLVITGAGLDEIRLRPGSYKVHADRDGQQVPLERELVHIAIGGREVVEVKVEGAKPVLPTAPAIERGCFVLQGSAGGNERKFDTLLDAANAASEGDAIEIRGNGPFLTAPVPLNRALTIRAGVGFRPVIRLENVDHPLLITTAKLALEGLELQRSDSKYFHGHVLVRSNDAPLCAANCRFRTSGAPWQVCIAAWTGAFSVRNCEFICPTSVAVNSGSMDAQSTSIENCVHVGRHFLVFNYYRTPTGASQFRINHNTVVATDEDSRYSGIQLQLTQMPADDKPDGMKSILDTTANLFQVRSMIRFTPQLGDKATPLSAQLEDEILPKLISWRDHGNICDVGGANLNWVPSFRTSLGKPSDWRAYWNQAEGDLTEGTMRIKGGDLAARAVAEPEKITPEDFRLLPDSAGFRAGKDGKDLGADIDFVGPGAAYERWKKTPAYQEWLKDSGQLRAAAPMAEAGAFVVLDSKGTELGKFDTLAKAVDKAHSGDTIEIRGNGPFFTDPLDLGPKALIIRAGAAYAPVIKPSPAAIKRDKSLIEFQRTLTLEGLVIHHQGVPETLSPDNFLRRHLLVGSQGASLFVTNCKLVVNPGKTIHASAIICESPERVQVRNSLLVASDYGVGIWHVPETHGTIYNCLIAAGNALTLISDDENSPGTEMRLSHNQLIGMVVYQAGPTPKLVARLRDKAGPPAVPILVESEGNVVQCWRAVSLNAQDGGAPGGLGVEEQCRFARQRIRWRERGNVYGVEDEFFLHLHANATGMLKGLSQWNEFWGIKDTQSLQGQVRLRGNPKELLATNPEAITVDDFRLRPDSAGYQAGKDGKDLGADIDLVGPGVAYERWKKTPEYQPWLKESGQAK